MFNMNWFLSLVFLGSAWSVVPVEEASALDGGFLPSFEVIESILQSSFENVSKTYLLVSSDGMSSRSLGENMTQETMSYQQHGMHSPNAESWKLQCVWEAMSNAARHLRQHFPASSKTDTLRDVGLVSAKVNELCTTLARISCHAYFEAIDCNPNDPYRTVDGTCNNLHNTRWGAASQPFERYLPAEYGDDNDGKSFRKSKNGNDLPNPRTISRILSSSNEREAPNVTLMLMQWGQFIDHDVTLTPEREHHEEIDGSKTIECCDHGLYINSVNFGTDCVPIDVTGDDYYQQDGRQCIRFVRSMPSTRGCSFTPMEQINQNTAFIDGSQVYGSTKEVADFVRTKSKGLLNVTYHQGNGQPLPPRGGQGNTQKCPVPESMQTCFLAGDDRVDEMPGLTAMHITFIRLHNIIAQQLYNHNVKDGEHHGEHGGHGGHHSTSNWDDEKIFQETRRIVTALIQQITYRDWLPHVLGPNLMEQFDLDTGTFNKYKDTYNASTNPTIRNVFATAAFRFGHTLLTDFVKAATEKATLPLEGHFFNTTIVQRDGTSPSSLLKGLARCPSEPIDGFVANTFTDKLFATPRSSDGRFFGFDLVSLNIQRGRDHGIPSYKRWRNWCGLEDIKSFTEMKNHMEENIVKKFSTTYEHIKDVDIFPAALSEYPIDGGLLGPTFSCILARQFAQIKHGDRFWYERKNQPKPFTPAQLLSIRNQGLASILCAVSKHTEFGFQPDPFLVSAYPGNGVIDCSLYPFINLNPWFE